jgi:tripartite motif-containing protein 2/3/tripartite motif-containing protein 71
METERFPKNCVYCQGPFKDPKVLPCFHILCRECVRSLRIRGVEEMKCPVNRCSKRFVCEAMDPESLPDASVVYHLKDLNRFKEKLENKEILCDHCFERGQRGARAVAQCDRCKYVCHGCKKRHAEDRDTYSDHNIVSFLELSLQQDDMLHMEVLKRSRSMSFVQMTRNKCKVHPKIINTSFCMDCKIYTCPECIKLSHSSHRYRAASIAADECTGILQDRIPQIQLAKNQALDAVEFIKERKTSVEDQRTTLTSSVDATFERLSKILMRRRDDLKAKITNLAQQKVVNLSTQQFNLEKLAGELERMAGFTEKILHSSTERELLTVYPFLHDRSKESIDSASSTNLSPVEAANIALKSSCGRDLTDLCRRNLEVYLEQANSASCSTEGPGLQSAQTMQYSHFVVNVVDKNHRPCSTIQNVVVKVKCCKNEFEVPATVRDRGVGRYRVSYCPEFRGRHEIKVSVNDKQIAGSPFSLNVEMPKTQLGISQGSILDVTQPRGIIITPDNRLLVGEWNGKRIIEMDRIGRRSRALGSEDISHPASLALSPSGDFFVVEGMGPNAGVKKWAKTGNLLTSACGEGSELGKFKSPRGMKIGPKREVFVCDRDNCRIQVFDMNLHYLRCINLDSLPHLDGRAKPNDLAFDQAGNVYVADYSNNCIHKLGPDELYLTSFSKSTDGQLAGPESIAVDADNYLYVTESHNHRISVFKTSGECVKAFGCKGRADGELNFPMGIAIDDCGDIFVCELLNNRIQIF